jgi:hypothetical protein
MTYQCAICGALHDDLPDIGADEPDPWWDIPEEERARRVTLTPDTCIIAHDDQTDYFIRGVIEIPLLDYPRRFGFGVWVSQKRENFLAYCEQPDTDAIGPFFGWLMTRLACYPENTLSLKTMAHFRTGGLRPTIELEHTDHPLAVDQHEGITLARAWELVHFYMDTAHDDLS